MSTWIRWDESSKKATKKAEAKKDNGYENNRRTWKGSCREIKPGFYLFIYLFVFLGVLGWGWGRGGEGHLLIEFPLVVLIIYKTFNYQSIASGGLSWWLKSFENYLYSEYCVM